MSPVVLISVKALAGGTFVVLFALISETVKPKMLAGLFGAAPAVALASLLMTSLIGGRQAAAVNARGMVFGAIAMVVYCLVAVFLVRRLHALAGSVVSWGAWGAVAIGMYAVFLR
jgi:uncharacterized membrane protein (GlpM family)